MIDVYALCGPPRVEGAGSGNVSKVVTATLLALTATGGNSGGDSFGNVEATITLPFDAAQHRWTSALTAAVVAAAAAQDVETVGGYNVIFVYLADYESIKP